MADITLKDVENTARLAKLEFSQEQKEVFAGQFSRIIHFVEQIGELDTESVPPTTHAVEKTNVTRPDTVQPSLGAEEIAKVAPRFAEDSIIVPKVIEH